jgi:hypothetical protein
MEHSSLWRRVRRQSKAHKITFAVYLFLRTAVFLLLLFSLFRGRFGAVFFCLLSLLLFRLPFLLKETLQIDLPAPLEITVLFFIFCSQILGEASSFYLKYPLWDTALHTLNGFLCAAVGFSLIELLNRHHRFCGTLSPAFVTVVAFCFSMTVGVLWEFFEFFMDSVFSFDMQKDFLIHAIHSVALSENGKNVTVSIENIAKTVLYDEAGNVLFTIEGGFLDTGIFDTMKDLIVNFIGALVFCFFGYFYVKNRGRGKFAKSFIPSVKERAKD